MSKKLNTERKKNCLDNTHINSKDLEQVKLYKYHGSVFNWDNSSEADIKDTTTGN